MIKKITLIISFILILSGTNVIAQETQVSLLEEISNVYVEKLIAVAKENYPRIKSLNSRIAVAQSSVANAKLGWLTPLSVSYVSSPANNLNVLNPTFFRGYQIGFSLNVGSILQNPANVKRAKAELKISEFDRDEYYLTLATEVKTRYITYLQSLKGLKLISQTNIDAHNALNQAKYKFEKGELTFDEYNNALARLATSDQGKLDAEAAVYIAKATLEELLGVKLEEVPN